MDFMKEALIEAEKAMNEKEIPVGAVVIKDGKVIGRGYNQKEKMKNPTEHAEIIAIREACTYIGDWRLNGCEMYVTLEPCPMCAGAILQSRISKLHIGTFNKDMGACGSVINLIDNRSLNSFVNVIWTYDERCSSILKRFFDLRRSDKKR